MNRLLPRFNYLLLLPVVLVLAAAGCRGEAASIGQAAITTQVDAKNKIIGLPQSVILSTTPVIYLSTEVVKAAQGDQVEVEWRYVTGNRVLATESFRGERAQGSPHEFLAGPAPATSFLASRIILSDLSWPTGSYEAVVRLNGQLAGRVGFNVADDKDFEELSKKAMLKKLYLGSQINNQGQIAVPGNHFNRNQEAIYAVVLLQDVPAGTTIKAAWKYLDGGQMITDFSASFGGGGYLPFEISLDKFSRLWPDGLWPEGVYEVVIYVDNVQVTTKNFTVS